MDTTHKILRFCGARTSHGMNPSEAQDAARAQPAGDTFLERSMPSSIGPRKIDKFRGGVPHSGEEAFYLAHCVRTAEPLFLPAQE